MASQIMVANETTSRSSRMTKDGRKITYQMTVIQQPERARACGSGAKSSADRRPVDPPPIVELRIYEGDQMQNETTFSYNANFFLFATLENARNIAQGRVPTSNAFPVLTGTPVAGMAYLDRPAPAGYFIFPDLSVRHEGKYRLSFALYEELKDQKDMDSDDSPHAQEIRLREIDAHVSHRLEVKSAPFTVFSAKKFPGLTESTALSRMVAEQGCRVRIRRDVRMRRRDNKGSKDWDDYEEEAAYERARRTATPDGYGQSQMATPQALASDGSDRPRSVSNASITSFGPPGRRPSMQEMAQAYQQGYQQPPMPPPQTPQSGYSAQMPYGTPQSGHYQQQYTPNQPPPQPMMQPPQQPYQPQTHAYQQQPQPQPQMQMGYVQSQPQYPQHDTRGNDGMEYPSAPSAYRRASGTMLHPPQQPEQYSNPPQMQAPNMSGWGEHRNPYYPNQQMQSMPPAQVPHQPTMPPSTQATTLPSSQPPLAPLKTLQPVLDHKPEVSPPYTPNPMSAMGDYSNGHAYFNSKQAAPATSSAPMSAGSAWAEPGANYFPPPKFPQQPTQTGATKRTFGSTFDTNHVETRLSQGQRPNVAHSPDGYTNRHFPDSMDEDGDDAPFENASMSYRRADGSERRRRVPLTS